MVVGFDRQAGKPVDAFSRIDEKEGAGMTLAQFAQLSTDARGDDAAGCLADLVDENPKMTPGRL